MLLYGKGSGKDLIASFGIAYITYLVNLLKDAQEYFGLADGENIDIVNIATNSRQANNACFAGALPSPVTRAVCNAPRYFLIGTPALQRRMGVHSDGSPPR